MANNYTSIKLSYESALKFVDDISLANTSSVKYLFLGNSNQYANSDVTIPDLNDTVYDEKSVWSTMFAAKRITGNDVHLVVPRYDWEANLVYQQYDDIIELDDLLTANANTGHRPMYVLNSEGNVYKCICNDVAANSTIEPTGDFSTSNGYITTTDNYMWKYMYNVRSTNKFLTSEWMPTPRAVTQEYSMSDINIVDGALAKIKVIDRGSGYTHSNIYAYSFSSGTTELSIDVSNTITGITNMFILAPELIPGTYITEINPTTNLIKLSQPTVAAGNGVLQLRTRIIIVGDGNEDFDAEVRLANSEIDKVTITNIGTNYSFGNVVIYGTGSGANARIILPTKYGHGFNPARELGARSIIISKKIGELDTTENGIFSSNVSFRQYGILSSPHKYGQNTKVSYSEANNVISQTYDLDITPGDSYILQEKVYQGFDLQTATFTADIHDQTASSLRLINTQGNATSGDILIGVTSGTTRAVSNVYYPEFERYTGDILYAQNIPSVQRTDGQAENIKFVINF